MATHGPVCRSPPAKTPGALGGVSDRVDLDRAIAREGEAGDVFKGREVRPLADGRDQLIAFDLKLAAGDGHGPLAAGGIRFGQLHADAAQPDHPAVPGQHFLGRGEIGDAHPLGFRRLDLLLPGRHLAAGAAVDDGRLFCAEAYGRAGDVDGDVAAADDRHLAADPGHAGEVDLAQEVHALADAVGLLARHPELDPLMGPQCQVDRLVALAEEVIDGHIPAESGVELYFDAQVGDDLDLLRQDLPRQPVGRDADTQHAARL